MVNTDYIKWKKDPYHVDYGPIKAAFFNEEELINWKKPKIMEEFAIKIEDRAEFAFAHELFKNEYYDFIMDVVAQWPVVLYFRGKDIWQSSLGYYDKHHHVGSSNYYPLYNLKDHYVQIKKLFKPQPKPNKDKDIEIGKYTVEFKDSGIKVGCVELSRKDVKTIYYAAKLLKRDDMGMTTNGSLETITCGQKYTVQYNIIEKIYKRLK